MSNFNFQFTGQSDAGDRLTHQYAIVVTRPDGHSYKLGVRFYKESQADSYITKVVANSIYDYKVVREEVGEENA
jgi:hypothetical protein